MLDDLVSKIEAYLDGSITLEDFEVWFYDLSFDIEKRFTGDYVDKVHQIEGILAESSSGSWSVDALRRELDKAIEECRPSLYVWHVNEPLYLAPVRSRSSAILFPFAPVWQAR